MSIDTIANFCTVIRNGYLARKREVEIPYSRFLEKLGEILVREGYLQQIKIKEEKFKKLEIKLKYDENDQPSLRSIERVSKPGRRIYKGSKKIPKVLSGLGIVIVSTSRGLMTDKEAKKLNLGGELICKIW